MSTIARTEDNVVSEKQSEVNPALTANVVIRASAGTGKTFQLTNRYLRQLFSGAPPEEILATTFTRKAAGEILERNMLRLAEAALDDAKCRELATFLEKPELTRDDCLKLLQNLTRGLHRIRICTLDSFFSQVASSFGFEMGLPPDWSIVDEIDDVQLKNKAVQAVLKNEKTDATVQLMHLLTKGETTRTVGELIRQLVDSLYSIFLQTTADAWKSFPRTRPLSKDKLKQAIECLKSVELPQHKSIADARTSDLANAAAHDWDAFVSNGIAKVVAAGQTTYYRKDLGQAAVEVYSDLIRHARAVLVDLVARQTEATYDLLSRFDLRYSQLKDDARLLQFDDVTRLLADVAQDNDIDRLSYRMDGRISHILLDEFQDTSLPQWQVIRPFAKETTRRKKGRSFFCVGDVKQAIYGWRGGVAEIFDAIETELKGLTRTELNRSFRSAPAIMDVTNSIFNGLRALNDAEAADDFDAVHQWCRNFQDHSTARENLPGYARLVTAPAAHNPDDSSSDQFDLIMRRAAGMVAEMVRRSPHLTIGVLARRNKVVSRMIFELRQLGIAASEEGGNPLTDSAAVQLIMSLLKLADHPGNTVARFHVAQSPLGRALGFTEFGSHRQAERLARSIRDRLQSEGYGPLLREWADVLMPSCAARGRRRLSQLVELGYVWQNHSTLRTTDFLRFVELKKVPDPTADKVRVMTVHQSKGLEFDIVVLPDLDQKLVGQPDVFVVDRPSPTEPIHRVCRYRNAKIQELLPDDFQRMFRRERQTEISEAMCVLYVAVTRARHALHMLIAPAKPSEKKVPKTIAGLLRMALADGVPAEPNRVLYECGDPDWQDQLSTEPAVVTDTVAKGPDTVKPIDPVKSGIAFAPMTAGRQRGLSRKAPSKHQQHRKVRLSSVIGHENLPAMERGTLIHAWFEQIEWIDGNGVPDDDVLLQKAAEVGAGSLDVDKLLKQFRKMLKSPQISAGLTSTSYRPPKDLTLPPALQQQLQNASPEQIRLEVRNEHPFAVREGGEIVSGFIDRLVLIYLNNQLIAGDIVDFKTDTFAVDDPASLQQKVDYYQDQLDAYRRVVSLLYRLPPEHISARLFMVGAGKIADV
ncbi:MAG: UvrD-helicase domain-containing protein [Planctomycetaceae bacterium]|nr:UvrD-helicase domain-containing protein [Planctomycetaceae bacterium]